MGKTTRVNKNLVNAIFAALFAAVITVMTAYVMHIPVGNGYIHLGDCFIFIAASLLPTPYAVVAAAIGAGIADAVTAPIWIPATVIVKALIALVFTSKDKKMVNKRNIIAIIIAIIITCGGYYVYEGLIYHNWAAAVVGLVPNVIQIAANGVIFLIVGTALDAAKFKSKVFKLN